MNKISKKSRSEFKMFVLEEFVSPDSDVRMIDNFVDSINLTELGFEDFNNKVGRPSYPRDILVKLLLYGYMNGIRTTRKLEKACQVNMELRWLLCELTPAYRTIGEFRRKHEEAFANVFQKTVQLALIHKFIEGQTIAFDSFPIRASNSRKNNYKGKKLDHLKNYAQDKLNLYIQELAKDDTYTPEEQDGIEDKIDHYDSQLNKYEDIQNTLDEKGINQVSYTDPDSRILPKGDFGNFLGYRIQCAADSKHSIVCGYEVCNDNDIKHAVSIAKKAKANLGSKGFDGLYDKGYHSGPEMAGLEKENITPFISPPSLKKSDVFPTSHFIYDPKTDSHTCPAGQTMTAAGKWRKRNNRRVKSYTNPRACRSCDIKSQCTTRKQGRLLVRYDHFQYVDQNRERIENNPDYYKKRAQIIEHIFGTIKRQWKLDHTVLRTKEKVGIEYAIAFTCYNLKRIKSLFGDNWTEYLNKITAYAYGIPQSATTLIFKILRTLEIIMYNIFIKPTKLNYCSG